LANAAESPMGARREETSTRKIRGCSPHSRLDSRRPHFCLIYTASLTGCEARLILIERKFQRGPRSPVEIRKSLADFTRTASSARGIEIFDGTKPPLMAFYPIEGKSQSVYRV
jgi:hypothetical protein